MTGIYRLPPLLASVVLSALCGLALAQPLQLRADGPDADLVAFVRGTDILIHDATYTEEEYRTRHGWGHATWSAAAELATAGRVGSLVLFHHDPDHDDDWMDAIGAAAARSCPDAVVAREGMRIALASLTEYQGATASFGSKPHI